MQKAIWELLRVSAKELTRIGQTPFTRGDLISSVQLERPDCPDNSINPIIQGITDNLRGGAPGAVGKLRQTPNWCLLKIRAKQLWLVPESPPLF